MIKTRSFLHLKDFKSTKFSADYSLKDARDMTVRNKYNPEGDEPETTPRCLECQELISAPCWYCLDCYQVWICDSCEANIVNLDEWKLQDRYRLAVKPFTEGGTQHNVHHILLRLAGRRLKRLRALVDKRFKEMDDRIEQRFGQIDGRLEDLDSRLTANIERLLNSVISSSRKRY
ncbi:hypothetical protein C8F01DRAFT_1246250 [Mycena amicta]|nr:hypothetical protein C8F01DRAFT_1246250 [Mycena amicta]